MDTVDEDDDEYDHDFNDEYDESAKKSQPKRISAS